MTFPVVIPASAVDIQTYAFCPFRSDTESPSRPDERDIPPVLRHRKGGQLTESVVSLTPCFFSMEISLSVHKTSALMPHTEECLSGIFSTHRTNRELRLQ